MASNPTRTALTRRTASSDAVLAKLLWDKSGTASAVIRAMARLAQRSQKPNR